MMHFSRTFFSCLLLVGFCATAADAQEWTRFRGPDGTGIGRAKGIPAGIDESSYTWKVKLPGRGHSSPVLWGNKIFLTCESPGGTGSAPRRGSAGSAGKANRQLVCLSGTDGKVLWTWRDEFTTYRKNGLNSFASSTPAVDAERAYLTWASGGKYFAVAIDHAGKKVWQRELGDFYAKHGAGSSPIVIDGTVLVGKDHAGEASRLFGLDAKTGSTRWKIDRKSGPSSYIVPAIYRPAGAGAQAIFISCAEGVTSVNPADGKVNWRVKCNFTLKSVASPVVAGGLIFVSAGRGGGGRESAVVRPPGGARRASIAYKLDKDVPYVPTPIAVGDYLFVLNDKGVLTCVEPGTGRKLWKEKFTGTHYPSPVCTGGRIYIINNKGEISTVQAASTYKLVATGKLPEGTHATPAVANGCMYIRTFNHLICVGAKK